MSLRGVSPETRPGVSKAQGPQRSGAKGQTLIGTRVMHIPGPGSRPGGTDLWKQLPWRTVECLQSLIPGAGLGRWGGTRWEPGSSYWEGLGRSGSTLDHVTGPRWPHLAGAEAGGTPGEQAGKRSWDGRESPLREMRVLLGRTSVTWGGSLAGEGACCVPD